MRGRGATVDGGAEVLSGDDRLDARKIRVLLDTIAELISTVDLDAVLVSIVDKAIGVVGAERGILFLFEDGDPERPRIRVARDHGGRDLQAPLLYSTTVTRRVAADGEPMCWKVSSHEDVADLSRSIVDMKLRAVMCTTLRVIDRRLGLIYVDSRASHREFTPADLRFFDALAGALAIAIETARLVADTVEHERVREQVKIARRIQEGLLPRDPEGVPGFDVAGCSIPAEEALGDYYDFVPLDGGRLLVAIGDVAGHGIGPALLMSSARALLRAFCEGQAPLEDAFARLNDRFEADTDGSIFMSLFAADLDPASRTLRYCNAGQSTPLLLRGDGRLEVLERGGLALGIEAGVRYHAFGPVALEPGDLLLLWTDGVAEARRGDAMFGRARLEESLREHRALPAPELVRAIHAEVVAFLGHDAADDDVTLVAVKAVGG